MGIHVPWVPPTATMFHRYAMTDWRSVFFWGGCVWHFVVWGGGRYGWRPLARNDRILLIDFSKNKGRHQKAAPEKPISSVNHSLLFQRTLLGLLHHLLVGEDINLDTTVLRTSLGSSVGSHIVGHRQSFGI